MEGAVNNKTLWMQKQGQKEVVEAMRIMVEKRTDLSALIEELKPLLVGAGLDEQKMSLMAEEVLEDIPAQEVKQMQELAMLELNEYLGELDEEQEAIDEKHSFQHTHTSRKMRYCSRDA